MLAGVLAGWCREGQSWAFPSLPSLSAPLTRALLPQGRLVGGGSSCGRSGGLFLPLPQSSGLLLLFCVALHVRTAALHLVKHPAAGQERLT